MTRMAASGSRSRGVSPQEYDELARDAVRQVVPSADLEAMAFGFGLVRVANRFQQDVEAHIMRPVGLTYAAFRVMFCIRTVGPVPPKEIARHPTCPRRRSPAWSTPSNAASWSPARRPPTTDAGSSSAHPRRRDDGDAAPARDQRAGEPMARGAPRGRPQPARDNPADPPPPRALTRPAPDLPSGAEACGPRPEGRPDVRIRRLRHSCADGTTAFSGDPLRR